ncbi:GNAT family N-acetyltransferase [Microlunatus elymi]|nr:GNAT family N-acetyltransferase [Microlunatus elymi]
MQHHTDPQLRPAVPNDADELFRMAQLLATSATPQRQTFDHLLTEILADPHQYLLVAAAPTGLSGYLYGLIHPAFHANGKIAWAEELFVDPDLRGAGLGRKLMTDFEDWAKQVGHAQYIAVATRRAHDFYDAIGFAESATYFKKTLT